MLDHKTEEHDVIDLMAAIGDQAKAASGPLAIATTKQKNSALEAMAKAIVADRETILAANAQDMKNAQASGMAGSFLDRLKLDSGRIQAMADGILAIAALDDPVGTIIAGWERPNGLKIERVRTPLGVIGVIYESRPNVTADAGALCLPASASNRGTPPFCAAAPIPSIPPGRSMPVWCAACSLPACPNMPSSWCRSVTAQPSAKC